MGIKICNYRGKRLHILIFRWTKSKQFLRCRKSSGQWFWNFL